MIKIYDVVVIGGGPGGIYASFLADVKGLSATLIEAGEYLGGQPLSVYSQKAIYDYPGQFGIKGYELANMLIDQLTNHSKVKVHLKTKVESYEKVDDIFTLSLSNGEKIGAKRIIIAIGNGLLNPLKLEIPGSENANIDYSVGDFNNYKGKKVVILGGGDSAVDWANELAKRKICSQISIIHRRDAFRATGDNVNNLKLNNVNVVLDSNPIEIQVNKIMIQENKTQKIQSFEFDKIIVQYGQKVDLTNSHIFANFEKNEQNRIVVKENQMTNIDGIYAIGNVCVYKNKPSSIIASHGEAARAIKDIINTLKIYDKY